MSILRHKVSSHPTFLFEYSLRKDKLSKRESRRDLGHVAFVLLMAMCGWFQKNEY